MKEEIGVFFTAVMFYTRIPCPSWVDHSADYINKSVRYFPVIGWIIGTVSSLGFLCGAFLVSPLFGAVLFSAVSVWLTGAFHEDGFSDVCDGFGGGWTKEQILQIMKDSRVGTYAVVGLVLLFLLKTSLLAELSVLNLWTLFLIGVNGHTLSRLMAASVIFTHTYVREDEQSKAKPVAKAFTRTNIVFATILGMVPIVVLYIVTNEIVWLALPFALYLIKMYMSYMFKKRIGGYTGDCLGAVQQVTEVTFYLLAFILWKFIL